MYAKLGNMNTENLSLWEEKLKKQDELNNLPRRDKNTGRFAKRENIT